MVTEFCLSPKSRQLLRHLAGTGSFARHDAFRNESIALYRVCNHVTLGAGQAPLTTADELVKSELATWSESTLPKLLITDKGKKHLDQSAPSSLKYPGTASGLKDGLKQVIEIRHEGLQPIQINMNENPLLWLHRRKGRDGKSLISNAAFAAGERFRADLTISGTLPRVTSNWTSKIAQGAHGNGAGLNASEAMVAASQRVGAAAKAVGPEFSGLLIDVCGFLKGLELVERERGWPARSAKLLLVMGLKRLAAHYGMSVSTQERSRSRPSVWQSAGARPFEMPLRDR